ncbi:hypothetical protein HDU87_005716 [Geranomyces variabilis]|uniref:Uncharacterized protein n=1 Tax=Geranomyces variabilis TaxID=109894 RepID=A0AAD5XKX7_9FUNG|nr:hypothetical protein HDU87_005716 [Geranomyces variabilis]
MSIANRSFDEIAFGSTYFLASALELSPPSPCQSRGRHHSKQQTSYAYAAAQQAGAGWPNNEPGDAQPTLSTVYDEDNQYDEFGEDQFNQQEFDFLCQATQPEAFAAPAIEHGDDRNYEQQQQTYEDDFANPVLSTAEGNDVADPELSIAEEAEEKAQAEEEKARHAAEVKRLEDEKAELHRKYQELVNERFAKDGEIKTTRKRLEEAESEKERLERSLALQSSQAAKEKAEIEEECKRKMAQLQDEVRFYEHEKENASFHEKAQRMVSTPASSPSKLKRKHDTWPDAEKEVFVVSAKEEPPAHFPAISSVNVATEMSQPLREGHPVPILSGGPRQVSDAVLFVQNFVSEPDTLDYVLASTRRGNAEFSIPFSADIAGLTFDQRAAYKGGMQRLMGNLSQVLTGASDDLSTLLPSLEWLLGLCVEHTVLRPVPVFLRMVWLICQHCKRCCIELLTVDSNGRPKAMMPCFQRLLNMLVACPRRDGWEDDSLRPTAHYLFQILGALASSVPADARQVQGFADSRKTSDMDCILDDRQDPGTCAEALEFCFYLVPDREFIKMLLGSSVA